MKSTPTIEEEAEAIEADALAGGTLLRPRDDPAQGFDSCWLYQMLHGPDGAPPGETIH